MKRTLGTDYPAGAEIVREGEPGDCMYVVQSGSVEVIVARAGAEQRIAVLGEGRYFGEMALFEQERRTATVRALGPANVLRVDKRTLLRRISEDPSLALDMLREFSTRLREANARLAKTPEEAR